MSPLGSIIHEQWLKGRVTPLKRQYHEVNILWMSKLNSAFIVIHIHTDLICWITHIKSNSGAWKLGTYTPGHWKLWSISLWVYHGCHMVGALDVSLSANLAYLSTADFFAKPGMSLQERFRSLTRMVDSMPRLINHQLVTLRWLTQTKTKWPHGSWISLGQCTAQWKRSQWNAQERNTTWAAGPREMFLQSMVHVSFIHLFFNHFYVYLYSTRFFCSSYVEDYLKHAVLIKVLCIKPNSVSVYFEDMILSICNQVILKVCPHPFTLSAVDNARRELETQSLNKLCTYLAST